jgi:hypothetical protein
MAEDVSEFRLFVEACGEDVSGWADAEMAKALARVDTEHSSLKAHIEKNTKAEQRGLAAEWFIEVLGEGYGRLTRKAAGNIPLPGIRFG